MTKPKFPKVMFISERGAEGEKFWTAESDRESAIDNDGPTFVAEYELVGVTKMAKVAKEV